MSYHSPHKFRHGHTHYGSALAGTIEDFKAISMNVTHSSMKITDEFYSNLNDHEVQNRIGLLGKDDVKNKNDEEITSLIKDFLKWKESKSNIT